MKIVIAGGTGFIGKKLVGDLSSENEVLVLTRGEAEDKGKIKYLKWNPYKQDINFLASAVSGCDAVINLAGESIANKRWSRKEKDLIIKSRIISTRYIVDAIEKAEKKPKILVNSSAIGYYKKNTNEELNESSGIGADFLSKTCIMWENEAMKAAKFGINVSIIRTGIVIGKGGILERLDKLVKKGFSAYEKDQWLSWIDLQDLSEMIRFIIYKNLKGPFNAVSPNPIQMSEFFSVIAEIEHKKKLIRVPSSFINLLLGDMARLLLFPSQKVVPKNAIDAGFLFRNTDIRKVLLNYLKA
ncbi:TIGR01777 family oxidoreductase [Candidatus Parvarchaeota archaeon]|nr:TIGR01777 family oxidoreductase [Candidatus Parvarchaeota archaeon]